MFYFERYKMSQSLGKKGEEYSANYLISQGYQLLEQNYQLVDGEIDLIVQKEDSIIFVEVKSRTIPTLVPPSFSITKRKMKRIGKVALHYLELLQWEENYSFDVILVYFTSSLKVDSLEHLENAFSLQNIFPDLV